MKRYFVLAGVDHESNNGRYCHADDVFDVVAQKDGLWLHTPKIDGVKECINLLTPERGLLENALKELWQKLYNTTGHQSIGVMLNL